MKTDLYNLKNEVVGAVEVPDSLFGAAWRPALVAQVVLAQLANRRRPWAHAKGRGEVRGGGKKPWRQKGTGRARHGSIRSPLWVGGGKAHGPQKERNYEQKVNKKMRRGALASALSRKLKDKEIKFVDALEFEAAKTKLAAAALRVLLALPKDGTKFDALLVPAAERKHVFRAAANLPRTKVLSPTALNVFDVLKYRSIVIDKDALAALGRAYARTGTSVQ